MLTQRLCCAFFVISSFACATTSSTPTLSNSDKAMIWVQIANTALLQNDSVSALESLEKAEHEDSSRPEIYEVRGLVFYKRHDLPRAIESVQKALKIKPDYSEANNTLGKFYLDLNDYKSAQAPLESAANDVLYREAYKAKTNLGILYYRRNQYQKSREYFESAILDSPDLACVAYYYRGHLELKTADFTNAIRDYENAVKKFCAGFANAYFALGVAYEESRQFDRARKEYLDIQKRFPNTKVADEAFEHLRSLP